ARRRGKSWGPATTSREASWSAAVLCRFRWRNLVRKRQRTAALQDLAAIRTVDTGESFVVRVASCAPNRASGYSALDSARVKTKVVANQDKRFPAGNRCFVG